MVEVVGGTAGIDETELPTKYQLSQNYPNPFNLKQPLISASLEIVTSIFLSLASMANLIQELSMIGQKVALIR
jgi:hypothetical protein